jgi:two-component system, OmpR family, sensor histidine kinase BaeS
MITYIVSSLNEENFSLRQMAIELESHLDEPIVKIKLYGPQGVLLVQVEDRDYDRKDMGTHGHDGLYVPHRRRRSRQL